MGYKDITAGDKKGKAISARFIKSKGDKPGIEVAFEFEEETTNKLERLNWIGWLTPKALENTMNTLANVLESNGSEEVDSEGVFTNPGFLNTDKELTLVIELDEQKDTDGVFKLNEDGSVKTYPKIQWVNNVGGSSYEGCSPDVVKNDLKALGFKAAFLSVRKASGLPDMPPKPPTPETEVPF